MAIARVVLKRPNAIFLDEATAMLDSITEKEINKSLIELTKDKTCVIVAHRKQRLNISFSLRLSLFKEIS